MRPRPARPEGRRRARGLPGAGRGGRRGGRELPPRRGRPARHRLRRRSRRAIPGIVYCSTSGYGQDGPRANAAGHDINYLAVGGFLAMSTPGVDGAPPLPGATIADAAAGGMQAALAITAALAGRAATGEGAYLDVVGGRRRPLARCRSPSTSSWPSARHRAGPRHPLGPLRLLRHLPGGATASGWPSAPSRPSSSPTSAGPSAVPSCVGLRSWTTPPSRPSGRLRRRLRHQGPRRVGRAPGRRRHLRGARARGGRGGGRPAVRRPRRRGDGHPSDPRARFSQLAPLLAGMDRTGRSPCAARPGATDTEHLLKEAGVDGETIAALGAHGGWWHDGPDLSARRSSWSARSSTPKSGSSRSSAATSGPRARRWRTATRCSGTTRWPRR